MKDGGSIHIRNPNFQCVPLQGRCSFQSIFDCNCSYLKDNIVDKVELMRRTEVAGKNVETTGRCRACRVVATTALLASRPARASELKHYSTNKFVS